MSDQPLSVSRVLWSFTLEDGLDCFAVLYTDEEGGVWRLWSIFSDSKEAEYDAARLVSSLHYPSAMVLKMVAVARPIPRRPLPASGAE